MEHLIKYLLSLLVIAWLGTDIKILNSNQQQNSTEEVYATLLGIGNISLNSEYNLTENIDLEVANTGSNNITDEWNWSYHNISADPNRVKFLLFCNRSNVNQSDQLLMENMDTFHESGFLPNQNTVFIIHGYTCNLCKPPTEMYLRITTAYLKSKIVRNIIVIEWGPLSTGNYMRVVRDSVPEVSIRVANFIELLINNNLISLDKIHLVGFSLGAHISGGIGKELNNKLGKVPARISGLDPASVLFQYIGYQRPLSSNDANFVDIYHTSCRVFGMSDMNVGHAHFFPNGGCYQPGCFAKALGCSHKYAYKFYAASIIKKFTACKCEPKFYYVKWGENCPGKCQVTVVAGEHCLSSARGHFYLKTSENLLVDYE